MSETPINAAAGDPLFGFHAVQSLLKTRPENALELLVCKGRRDQRLQKTIALAERNQVPVLRLTRAELDRYAAWERHQGCVLKASKARIYDERWVLEYLATLEQPPLVLVLDGLTDPHNLGACLRSADAAGAHAVIAPRDKSVGLTPVVRKVSCGAAERLPFVLVTNLCRVLEKLRQAGLWVLGAASDAEQTLCEVDLRPPSVIVMGSEERGLRRLTREHCDHLARIPMQGATESLNVSVATGILLFEAVRQRNGGG
ncbi:MAG: 23S rRNA (guanosine(2251)-2'-O)-methyltransferase RlmB [Cellvibrionales bacterium]|nr:23S rRNA (guanosine(2251)-2'-O)-methyltransferase RlmB [Cellvibrionales bacterium]